MKKNLVMGVAKGYGRDILEPFVVSFVKSCPSAELILFVDDISDFTRARLQRCERVKAFDIPAQYKEILIIHARWKMCADFLEQYGADYEQIFITDTRNVIFQGDVFEAFKGRSNYLGYSTEADVIGNDKTWNYVWLESCFGKAEADRLSDRKIICCGTVIGTADVMKIFCQIMWQALKDETIFGHEQATMNCLVHENLLPIENLIEIDVDGAIFTMGLANDFEVSGDKILRGGKIPAVVHQYDRHAENIWLVDKIYRDKNFKADLRFLDPRSAIEQATSLLFADKIKDAERLFMNNFLDADDFGNYLKALLRFWEIAMRKSLSPTIGRLELCVQLVLKSVGEFPSSELKTICNLLKNAHEGRRTIDFEFETYLVNVLSATAEQTLALNKINECRYCIELLKILGVSSDKVATYERAIGREAVWARK